jgi:predicted GH43/DUF377 family glycosyl hydrolase
MNSVFNAGATLLQDGSTLLLCRVEDRRGLSHLCAARSVNGVDGWQIDREPTLMPAPDQYPEELWGIEDPRITYVPELKQYSVAYAVALECLWPLRRISERLSDLVSLCRQTTKTQHSCLEGSMDSGH